MDLEKVWPIHLFRLFATSPQYFPDQKVLTTDLRKYWSSHVMGCVWDWGNPHNGSNPQYDNVLGRAHYIAGGGGGLFNLNGWMEFEFSKLACQDLAAISQLGCALLRNAGDGSEVLLSSWVFQSPNGFILPGKLYGWFGVGSVGLCNNPFFGDPGKCSLYIMTGVLTFTVQGTPEALVSIGNRDERDPFGNHVWLEIDYDVTSVGAVRGVLDATCIVENSSGVYASDDGSRTRSQYSSVHIDTAAYQPPPNPKGPNPRPGNLNNYLQGVPFADGDCRKFSAKYLEYIQL